MKKKTELLGSYGKSNSKSNQDEYSVTGDAEIYLLEILKFGIIMEVLSVGFNFSSICVIRQRTYLETEKFVKNGIGKFVIIYQNLCSVNHNHCKPARRLR